METPVPDTSFVRDDAFCPECRLSAPVPATMPFYPGCCRLSATCSRDDAFCPGCSRLPVPVPAKMPFVRGAAACPCLLPCLPHLDAYFLRNIRTAFLPIVPRRKKDSPKAVLYRKRFFCCKLYFCCNVVAANFAAANFAAAMSLLQSRFRKCRLRKCRPASAVQNGIAAADIPAVSRTGCSRAAPRSAAGSRPCRALFPCTRN